MERIEIFRNNKKIGKRLDQPVPQEGLLRYFFLLKTHFWKLMTLNLLFIAFSIPLVTLPAALCGMNRVLVKLIRDGNCFLWQEFIAEFKGSFKKSTGIGLLFGAALFVAYYLFSVGAANWQGLFGIVFTGAGLFALIFALTLGQWTFAFIAMLPLGIGDIFRNARALAGLERWRSAVILGASLAVWLSVPLMFPLSVIPFVLILPVFLQYTCCFLINDAAEKHIFRPHRTSTAQKRSHFSNADRDRAHTFQSEKAE